MCKVSPRQGTKHVGRYDLWVKSEPDRDLHVGIICIFATMLHAVQLSAQLLHAVIGLLVRADAQLQRYVSTGIHLLHFGKRYIKCSDCMVRDSALSSSQAHPKREVLLAVQGLDYSQLRLEFMLKPGGADVRTRYCRTCTSNQINIKQISM